MQCDPAGLHVDLDQFIAAVELAVETDDPESSAREIQQRVRAATDLDCSVGIGQNKLQAKLATGFGKPAGIFRLTHESWFGLLGERPTDVLWGHRLQDCQTAERDRHLHGS